MGAVGYPVWPDGTIGNGWKYSNGTLTLTDGTFDFSSTHPQGKTQGTPTITPVACTIVIESGVTITGGTFNGAVENRGTINNGTFEHSVENNGTIEKGTFEGTVTNNSTISGGTFQNRCIVSNDSNGTISGGTFSSTSEVYNRGTIEKGTFEGSVINNAGGTISGGTFAGSVTNKGTISGGTFQNTCSVTNNGTINDNGIFEGKVTNDTFGTILGGTFAGSVNNRNGGNISGGVFNGPIDVQGVGVYHITWDAASPKAKIEKVNGVSANWAPYAYAGTIVTITADTEIFSLNGKSIGDGNCNSSYPKPNDKKTVKFTMPDDKDVVLSTGELVMVGGFPVGSNTGTADCEGKGWQYSKIDESNPKGKLTLKSGTFDFSSTYPQNTSKGAGAEPVACAVETQLRVEITGGTFEGEVINNDLGEISGGTFYGTVTNSGYIKDGTFNGKVTNRNTIENGTFAGSVTNEGTIKNGSFEKKVTNGRTIMDGVFKGVVENGGNGTIFGGTFAGRVNNSYGGHIFGGVFNGYIKVQGAGVYSITVDTASSKAEIKEVNGESAVWNPYVVVTELNRTKEVTIKADTEIFSLNGRLLGTDDHVNGNKNTVKFTMPNDNVVLNGAITCTDLVMEKGWPKASNEGKISCSGTGWEYIKKSSGSTNTGTLYLMSGSEPFDFNFADPATKITRTDAAVKCAIESYGTISGGIFDGTVTNNAGGEISDGTFKGDVENSGYIEKGTFNGEVTNNTSGTIFGGTFRGQVDNNGKITGGIFAAGLSKNDGSVTGGIFNGKTGLTDALQVTVTNGSVSQVNGEGPLNADGTTGTAWDLYSYKDTTVTIIASTEIFSLNGQPIDESSYGNDKTTVTFTMPGEDVVLNGAITSTDLVMEKGWPKDSNGGKTPCKGDGWEYIKNDPTNGDMLLLTDGLFDFSTIGDGSAVECKVFVGKPTAITGGEFNGKVINNSGILGGTFHGEVENMGPGTIKDGTFKNSVENNGMIENGAFHDAVKNNGTINDGAFHGKVENNSVINSGTFHGAVENNGMIENGTFNDAVKNNGTIENGTFHGAVENNGTINGGVFNGAVTGSGTVSESITGSGTLNGEPITKTEPEPEPEPTTYTVTVIGGTIDGKTSVSAKENDTLTVVLDQNDIPDGMTFDMWSISSSKLSGDINVDYRAEAMTFQMPPEDVTIRAQYRSAEIIEDAAPSPLATAATIAVGGAAAGIVVWQGVNLGVDLYLANALPQGVPVPTDRRALALLLWETAGKPEVALPTLYGDIPAEEIELQKATRWAVQNGLMDAADKKDASFFDPDHYVTKMDVFGAWLRLKKLLGTT